MTPRERFLACFRFEPVDHVPDHEFGYWADTFTAWHPQGLPTWVTDNGLGDRYFKFEPAAHVPIGVGISPGFRAEVVEETARYQIIRDSSGVLLKQFTDGSSSIPHYLEFPLKTRRDWEAEFLPRLQLDRPYPADWEARRARWANRDYPLGISCGSLYGWLRNWMGLEGLSIAIMTEPEWVDEMMERLCQLTCASIERAAAEVELDFASFWEDMSANHGPLLSPKLFREMMTPRYQRITGLLRARGVEVFIVDSDGNINQLVEPWLEGGVNCMFPLEMNGNSDPVALRAKYGRRVLLKGGVDKNALRAGKAAIDAELARIAPVVAGGGYIPTVDHRVPPDVRYEDYLYYLRRKRERFGIPEPGFAEAPLAAAS
ncbi:MAG: hypothetical protein HUU35_09145 [Armatimonadetes bacterium]|nr:hypothetical protein [Armatimonadota bacterium]